MSAPSERPVLWTPPESRAHASTMAQFIRFLSDTRDLQFNDYQGLWRWSIGNLDDFWTAIRDFFDLDIHNDSGTVLENAQMPGARWFPGAKVNFAAQILSQAEKIPERPALAVESETFGHKVLDWAGLSARVAGVAEGFRRMGLGCGDRVVAVLPNTEVAMIAFLATASIGAIWSLCAPDMGHVAILDRFRQIAPKLLIAQDGYVHGGRTVDRRGVLDTIRGGLETLENTVWVPFAGPAPEGVTLWDDLAAIDAKPDYARVDFDHPLWVVYSSGTTGTPKPIVQGHGGVMLEGAKQSLHQDLSAQDRFLWLTSSGWIMWNAQTVALGQGACVHLYDGAPNHPDMGVLWRYVARERITYFGAGAAFFTACIKAGVVPRKEGELSALRSLGATGSPLTGDAYEWVYEAVRPDIWLHPFSGGTDLCGAFVGGNPMAPVRAGEMQCRFLGNAVRAFDEAGRELVGEVGELVCTAPLPSMPLFFWGDEDGSRLHASYFDTYPGVWRHGDWIEITPEGGAVIYGRSDATINRRGLRLGSSEIYRAVESLPEIMDSLVVDLEFLGRESFMPLFVVLAGGAVLDDALRGRINEAIRAGVSARFLPDEIVQIDEVPRTLSGKKLEVPVKKLLLGGDADKVVNRDSMANPASFDVFVAYAAARGGDGKGARNG